MNTCRYGALTECLHHKAYAFRVNRLNVKELLSRNWRDISNLSDRNQTLTYNHLVCKRILDHMAEMAKQLSRVVSLEI